MRPAAGIEQGSPQGAGRLAAARCGGELVSPRKPAGGPARHRGLPVKARSRPTKNTSVYQPPVFRYV